MSNSNTKSTHNRISGIFPKPNETTSERSEIESASSNSSDNSGAARSAWRLPRSWLIAFGIILAAGITARFWLPEISTSKVTTPTESRVLAVQTISIKPVSSYQTVREFTGTIVAKRISQLGFESSGKLQEIYHEEGDFISAGTAIAKLDTEHLETKRRQVVAKRNQASAKLDEMISGPRDEDIAAARARVQSLQAQVNLLKLQAVRQKKLVAFNAASQNEYEQSAFGLKARQARLNETQFQLEALLNGTRNEKIESQQAMVDEFNASISSIDVDLRKSTLRAPFDGTIARRLADEGTVVEAGSPLFRLIEDQSLEAWIGLPAQAIESLVVGSKQRLKIGDRYLNATVEARFPELDRATRTRTVVLKLADSAVHNIVHGQVVRWELEETIEADGYWLPSTALTKGVRGLWTSYVVAKDTRSDLDKPELLRVERRDIEVLHTESSRVLVRGTLIPGDRVISTGTHRVVPGQVVRLTNIHSPKEAI